MKKIIYMFAAAFAIALAGCTDEEFEKIINPVQTGDEIIFGSSITEQNKKDANSVETRTIYGNRTTTGIPVYWNPDGDTISIFCPQASAPARKMVNYVVLPDETKEMENWNTSAIVKKEHLEDAGLQWGAEDEHEFYAIYPAKGLKNAGSDEATNHGVLTATIPVTQSPTMWEPLSMGMGTTYFALPNMDYAFMWAHNHVNKSQIDKNSPINLKFHNLVTILDITIPGPVDNEEVTLTNINIESLTPGDILTGDFKFYIQDNSDNEHPQGYVEPVKSDEVRNTISISCWDKETKSFIKLKKGTYAVVKAYLVPAAKDLVQKRTLEITVAKLNGGAPHRKTLTDVEIIPQKVNRIVLPEVSNDTKPDNWMSSLDDNIYLSELSIPGSKFSYLTSKTSNTVYQTKDIAGQFADGIRAFIVQTGSKATFIENRNNVGTNWWPKYEYSYKIDSGAATEMPVTNAVAGTTFENTIKDITASLKSAQNECAFVVLTCNSSDCYDNIIKPNKYNKPGGDGPSWAQAWIETVGVHLKKLAENYPIYTDEITANTTIGDVRGKIIIKVNYNDESQEKYIEADDKVPALFSKWINPKTNPSLTPTADLLWGSPNPASKRETMKWMHVEATNVGENAEVTVDQKKTSITNMFQNAVDIYLEGRLHNTFFMTDIGGIYTSNSSTTDLARDMNMYAVEALQNRKENASTGLVFMNFADRDKDSGQKYQSDWIISTVIDNNFKFALRKRPSSN